jgi:hypothetical protein
MGCLSSVSFSILINGSTSSFFKARKGALDRDVPLSPLLFLLVVECLSHFLIEAKSAGNFRGIKILRDCISPIYCSWMTS